MSKVLRRPGIGKMPVHRKSNRCTEQFCVVMFVTIGSPSTPNKQNTHYNNTTSQNMYITSIKISRASHYIPLKGNFVPKFKQRHDLTKWTTYAFRHELGLHTNELRISNYQSKRGLQTKYTRTSAITWQDQRMTELIKQRRIETLNLIFKFPSGFFYIVMQP